MDVGADFLIPNAFALLPVDFDRDMDAYRAALGFLSDLAGGSDHDEALTSNGGSIPALRSWQRSEKFRRVYGKCQRAGKDEQDAARAREEAAAATEGEETPEPTQHTGQRFVPLEDMPVNRSVFSGQADVGSWGGP